jgi:hypothetical protein
MRGWRGKCEGLGMDRAGGIWSERPRREERGDLRGVVGRAWSSLLLRASFSWKDGEGARDAGVLLEFAFGGSEKERDFEGVLAGEAVEGGGSWESDSIVASMLVFAVGESSLYRTACDSC